MTIYVITLILVYIYAVIFLKYIYNRKYFLTCSFATMAVVLGLRADTVGEDTAHYLNLFDISNNISWTTIFTSGTDVIWDIQYGVERKIESGFMLFNKILQIFTDNGQWSLLIMAALSCWLIARFIYRNIPNHVFIATQVFLCEALYMNAFNLMRQMFAMSIAINTYDLIKEKKYKRALLVFLIAFMFHKSSIVLLALIPLGMIKNNQKIVKYVMLGSVAVLLMMPITAKVVSALVPRYSSYFNTNYWETSINGTLILWFIEIVICVLMYIKQIDNKDTFVGIACVILYLTFEIIGFRLATFSRIALYFRGFLMILFTSFIHYLPKKTRLFYCSGLLLLLMAAYFSYAVSDTRVYTFFWQ